MTEETPFGHLYALWLLPCDRLPAKVRRFEDAEFHVEGATEFRSAAEPHSPPVAWFDEPELSARDRMSAMSAMKLPAGSIVWASVPDPLGKNPKVRPLVVVASPESNPSMIKPPGLR